MKALNTLLIALTVLTLTTSCTKEDLSETNAITQTSKYSIDYNTKIVQIQTANGIVAATLETVLEIEVIEAINQYRISIDLPVVKHDKDVATSLAEEHSIYMVSKGKASHDFYFNRAEALKTLTGTKNVSENVAYGYTSAQSVVNGWLKSEKHKAVIEDDFNFAGVGIVKTETNKHYYTLLMYSN